jgi:hypothetical protein
MRAWLISASLLAAAAAHGGVAFVAPQADSQAIGPQIIEITTDTTGVNRVEFRVDGVLAGVVRKEPFRIGYDFGTTLTPRTVEARVYSDGYHKTETARVVTASLTAGESMNVDLVEVPMRVRSTRTLQLSDLRVRENSVEQTLREIQPVRGPAHFAFVVDRSLSMSGGKLEAALRAVGAAQKLLRAGDSTSLVLFNHHVARSDAPQEVAPSGGTALRDAVASTVGDGGKRTYVIAITDGGDRNSLLSTEAALQRISGTKTVVSAVVLGNHSPFLDRATRMTGGVLLAAGRDDVGRQVARILEDINSRYTLVYQSSAKAAGWRSIDIVPRRGGVQVISARKGYFAQ